MNRERIFGRGLSVALFLVLFLSTFSSLTRATQKGDLVTESTTTCTDGAYDGLNSSYDVSDSPWLRLPEDMRDWAPVVPPEPREVDGNEDPTGTVGFNIATREEIRLPSDHLTQQSVELPRAHASGDIMPETVFPTDDRVQINDTAVYPWGTIVNLLMYDDFDNPIGGGSGSVIDGYHVLTAGHCLFQTQWLDALGNVIWTGWVGSIKVVPGLNGTDMPYNYAWATYGRTYSGWVDDEDHRHDWAVLTLDRNVGLFTGWMGRMTADPDHSVYTGILHTAGYPGDLGGLDMYWDSDWGRTADEYNHWYYMDTFPGQSGSPVWFHDTGTGERYILTVHAYGDDGSGSNHGTRLNDDKYNRIITWVNEDTPPTDYADLIDDGGDFSGFYPNTVVRGETYFSVWTRLRNVGTATSSPFVVHFVASRNSIIGDFDDYLIGSQDISSIPPFGLRHVSWSGPFPIHSDKGIFPIDSYNVGLIIDADHEVTEFDEENNFQLIPSTDYLRVRNNPPVADANGPYYGTEQFPMIFEGHGSYDIDGTIAIYEWDFGDGNTGTGVKPYHTYTQAGTYTVTLTVTDNNYGTDVDTSTATVSEALPWIIEVWDVYGDVGLYTSIALDSWDHPHISYYDATNGDLKYDGWWIVDWTGNVGLYSSLALDSDDNPHISYYDETNYDLKYARWDGSTWSIETVDSAGKVGLYTSLALDSDDNPHISYFDWMNGDLKYARWDGSTWIKVTVDSLGSCGSHSSLALDSLDNPHISYYEAILGDLRYARWNGTEWSIETVEPLWGENVGLCTSLALDSGDNPHISYYDETNYDLKYARWDGSTWIKEAVERAGYVGMRTSLALDSVENPHISYVASQGLKYARWNGSAWHVWIVDTGFTEYSSLALDSWDNPRISYYYGYMEGYLKYAYVPSPNQPPSADANGPYDGTEGLSITFDGSASYDLDGYIARYIWDFGDGTARVLGVNPTHTYTQQGNYTVVLIVEDDDRTRDADITYVVVSDTEPTPDFSATPTSGAEPLTVSFTDLSTSYDGITSWEWDFNNDSTVDSTIQNPTYVYDQDGVYTVTLEVYEGDGDTSIETKIGYVVASDTEPAAAFSTFPRGGHPPLAVSFSDLSTSYDGIVSWLWNFGDDETSTEQNPTHPYTNEGNYTVSLTVYEADGDVSIEARVDCIIVKVGTVNVMFEEAHHSLFTIGSNLAFEVTGGYAEFGGHLTANGYFVSTIDPGTTIDPNVLAPADVLVIVAPMQGYSTSEIDAIETWVKGGGALLLITDWDDYGIQASAIAARFGITQPLNVIFDSDENAGGWGGPWWPYYDVANLLVHPVTAGVTRVEMYASDGITSAPADEIPLIVTDSDGTATWYDGSPALGVSLMSAIDRGATTGSGRLIVIADSNLWDSAYDFDDDGYINFFDSDNEILALNTINWLSEVIHDVTVTDTSLSNTIVGEGYSMSINVTVENQGRLTENFNVTVYANSTLIDTITDITLTSGDSTTITFTWDTTGFAYGNYAISATATQLPGESDTTDNTLIDGTVLVTIPGDVDGDLDVDYDDFIVLAGAYGSSSGHPAYRREADFDDDSDVDYDDFIVLAGNYGETL